MMDQDAQPTKLMGLRVSALLEVAIFLISALVLNLVFGEGHRFMDVQPHPFWFIVLLVACQYGTAEGLFAALASTVALLLFNLPEQSIDQSSYDWLFNVAKTPILWLVAAVLFGELRQRHIRERAQLKEELTDANEREAAITQQYHWTRELKEKLELRIAGQLRSSVSAWRAAQAMESLAPQEVLRGLEQLVGALMNPEKFSIYTLQNNQLTLALSHGWRENEPFAKQFDARTDLYRAVAGSQQTLVVANADHERTLSGQGMLAGPLLDRDTGEVVGMLKIESLGFTDLHISSVESFTAICEWAGMSLANTRRYAMARDGSIINPDHRLLTGSYFRRYSTFIASLAKRANFDVTQMFIRISNSSELSPQTRLTVARALADAVDQTLRGVDLAFDYQENSGEFAIVLPATDQRGANIVMEKIRTELTSRLGAAARQAQVSFSVQAIHQASAR